MAFSVGLRFYRIHVQKAGDTKPIKFSETDPENPLNFLKEFVSAKSNPTNELERSWFFNERNSNEKYTIDGVINYGTYGFESDLVDSETKKKNYRRKSTDVEEIPLYFQFWIPTDENYAFAAFQSFQGRSCINYITSSASAAYQHKFKNYRLFFKKLVPSSLGGKGFAASRVKELRLLRHSMPSDKADLYAKGVQPDEVEYEVIVRAKRNRFLGVLSDIRKETEGRQKASVFMMDGTGFDEVKASIDLGGKRRVVGVFGANSDTGVIEVSDQVKRLASGHPEINSIADEVRDLMGDFYETVCGK